MSNQTDIKAMFYERRAGALVEYRELVLRTPTPSKEDVERIFHLGDILGFPNKEIQNDILVSGEIANLRKQADQLPSLRKQESEAYEVVMAFDRAEEKRREQYQVDRRKVEAVYRDLYFPKYEAEQAKQKLDKVKQGNTRLFDVPRKQSAEPKPKGNPPKMVFVQGENGIQPMRKSEAQRLDIPFVEKMPLGRG